MPLTPDEENILASFERLLGPKDTKEEEFSFGDLLAENDPQPDLRIVGTPEQLNAVIRVAFYTGVGVTLILGAAAYGVRKLFR